MTEAEWLACTNPRRMLEFVRFTAPPRCISLFSCACCRRIWPLLSDERSRVAVEAREGEASGMVGEVELAAALEAGRAAREEARGAFRFATEELDRRPEAAPAWAAGAAVTPPYVAHRFAAQAAACLARGHWETEFAREQAAQADLLRDIVIPFCHVVLNPSWLTSTVRTLAEGIYQDRAFDRMPILADALQDAGCDSDDILIHCRGTGPHVRGCWVVDLVLGKE